MIAQPEDYSACCRPQKLPERVVLGACSERFPGQGFGGPRIPPKGWCSALVLFGTVLDGSRPYVPFQRVVLTCQPGSLVKGTETSWFKVAKPGWAQQPGLPGVLAQRAKSKIYAFAPWQL